MTFAHICVHVCVALWCRLASDACVTRVRCRRRRCRGARVTMTAGGPVGTLRCCVFASPVSVCLCTHERRPGPPQPPASIHPHAQKPTTEFSTKAHSQHSRGAQIVWILHVYGVWRPRTRADNHPELERSRAEQSAERYTRALYLVCHLLNTTTARDASALQASHFACTI